MDYNINNITRKVQLKQLKILEDVDRICINNKLKYYLVSGSALGAIRHQGFIPWDDDIDIALYRNDYNKLVEACKTELQENYFLQINDTDSEYYLGFAKIRINGTVFKESYYENSNMHHGIFLDIFPLDNIANNNFIANIQFLVVKRLSKIILLKYKKGNTAKSLIVNIIFSPIILFFSRKTILSWINKVIFLSNNKKSKKIINFFTAYSLKKELFTDSDYGNPLRMNFEGLNVPVPEKLDKYLTQLFGDYMQLPHEKDRVGHQIIEVVLGDES